MSDESFNSGVDKKQQLSLLPGQVLFDRYEVVRARGSGAFASVFECQDLSYSNAQVALKVFPPFLVNDQEASVRLHREIRASFSIDHHNVARFYDCLKNDSCIAIVMEFIVGDTLLDLLPTLSKQDLSAKLQILAQIAEGLRAIHIAGITHRDLKPANILITKHNEVKITDFGLSRGIIDIASSTKGLERKYVVGALSQSELRITNDSEIVGTPIYLSPEYLAEGILDYRSDIYAFGIVAYEVIAGKIPWHTSDVQELFHEKLETDIPNILDCTPDCPDLLAELIARCTERDPHIRIQDLDEIIRYLNQLKAESDLCSQALNLEEDDGNEENIEHTPRSSWLLKRIAQRVFYFIFSNPKLDKILVSFSIVLAMIFLTYIFASKAFMTIQGREWELFPNSTISRDIDTWLDDWSWGSVATPSKGNDFRQKRTIGPDISKSKSKVIRSIDDIQDK